MTTVEIPEGSGNRYRYDYEEGATVYKGPVGNAPALDEEEFLSLMEMGIPEGRIATERDGIYRKIKGNYYDDDGNRIKVFVKYGFTQLGNQEPYFSITAEAGSNKTGWSSGMQHEKIENAFEEFPELTRWHLTNISNGPMHYNANAKHHWKKDKLDAFKSTIVFGALPDDDMEDIEFMMDQSPDAFLNDRLPKLMEQFRKDMKKFNVPPPRGQRTREAIDVVMAAAYEDW